MLYAVDSQEMFVFDEDLNPLFNRKIDILSNLLMSIVIRSNVVFICSNTLSHLEVFIFNVFKSHFCSYYTASYEINLWRLYHCFLIRCYISQTSISP